MDHDGPAKPANLLLVEDNPDDVDLTLAALEDSGVHVNVEVVHDGEAAMAFLRGQGMYKGKPRPDLILLDLNLPRKDGREVLLEVKSDAALSDIPVVVLTTSSNIEDVTCAYRLHANCYITKPVDFERFSHVIRQVERFWLQLVRLPEQRG